MSAIVPFGQNARLPAYVTNKKVLIDVNKDVVTTAPYPTLSIKGKVFTLVQDNERRVMTRPDDPEEVLQSINVALVRLNMNHKVFYARRYAEGESDGQRPTCYSNDGVAPSAEAAEPQAKKCALCPHNQFGSRVNDDGTAGKGKACADQPRLAVADPEHLDRPFLLRVPPASIKNLKEALKLCKARDLQYNMVVFRIGFVAEAAAPQLSFRPVGLLSDEAYETSASKFDDEIVRAIVGLDEPGAGGPAAAAPSSDAPELDAALAARAAQPAKTVPAAKVAADDSETAPSEQTAVKPAPAPAKPAAKAKQPEATAEDLDAVLEAGTAAKPQPAKPARAKAASAPAPAPAPAPADSDDALLAELDSVLGSFDD